ncbi:pentapeptide repeat-containing protein [Streptomyces prunicolor]|uniref:pentapeptide repeat-containing protein n=1 Tax=Streptomyces prunicolor TaxID=67348 RepID=UPI00224F3C8B|nr:pentapeptide repeat-containing protein [Streptomyces prunicolor]MCX5238949.1 pentapeptide repeat-containing protein [Streptomyces prunicolor]
MGRTAWLAAVITVGMGVLLGWCVAFAPAWIVQHDISVHGGSQLSAADRLKAVNDVRVVLLQGAAGLVALGGIGLGSVLTLRQIRVSREGQFIDLFARAIEQLSSEQVSVRHGGAYAMEQIADAAPHYRGHVAALLASFVRQQAPWPPTRPSGEVDAERTRYTGGLRDDVGGAIAALSRRSMVLPGDSIELEKVDLRGAELVDHDLSRFCFAGSNLDGANLTGCDLSHTTFTDASLRNANLTGTTLTDANLTSADLTGATGIGTPPAPHHGPVPQN